MLNLFVNTAFELPEEDRLTNAFMTVLQHCDPLVLHEFLCLMAGRTVPMDLEAEAFFDLQIAFEKSRPDARIRVPGLTVVVETKRGEHLNESQFRNHWNHLQTVAEPTILLSLTKARTVPVLVTSMADNAPNHLVTARHVSWSDVLQLVTDLVPSFDLDSRSRLLLEHFEYYLRALGYYNLKGSIVDDLTTYGRLLMQIDAVETATTQQLAGYLERLKDAIIATDEMIDLVWERSSFRKGAVDQQRVLFEFLTADVPGLVGGRYRVAPSMLADGRLRLNYYLTYTGSKRKADPFTRWLIAHESELTTSLGGIDYFGPHPKKAYIFHVSRRLEGETAAQFFAGNDADIDVLGRNIAAFFCALDAFVRRGVRTLD